MRGRTDSGGGRRVAVERSLTLLHVFLLASAAILAAGAVLLSWLLASTIRGEAVAAERTSLTRYVGGVLRPRLVHGSHLVVAPADVRTLEESLRLEPDVVSVKVWRADGVLAWTNRGRARIGRRFALDDELREAIAGNRTVGSITDLRGSDEAAAERRLGFGSLLQVYAPIRGPRGGRPLGAYEIYADPASVDRLIGSRRRLLWLAIGGVFAALYGALALLVRRASATLRRQTRVLYERSRELLESYRRLEESALEAVASLNATVDAKDPYTAGHSQRVQRIALAIGDELGLADDRLDALRFGGLFHDIGKLGVPDAILTKPARLTADEYQLIKRHPADGARIVEKLGRLRSAVPLIRHHHERWDGLGYPDGLAGEEIPLEAGIVGLADAWDAMTTDRPYSRALGVSEAADEIRRGRGTQFAPPVVDAFFRVLRRRPAEVAAEEPALPAAAS